MKVKVDINVQSILKSYGLGPSTKGRKFLASEVRRRCDKYVPFDTGVLKNTAQVSEDGRQIVYPQQYASPQYTKSYRHSDPLRGPHWDRRMMVNEGATLRADFENYIKGRPG